MKIAVLEDEGDIAHLYTAILTDAGHDVRRVDQHDLDTIGDAEVVILDLMMPDVDGVEVLSWLHANKPDVRVVVASAIYQVPDVVRELAHVIVPKPMTPAVLLEAVDP